MTRKKLFSSNQTNEVLWEKFCRGDMPSFRKIYKNYYQPLYNYGIQFLDKNEAEDCIQDLFLYLLQHRNSIGKINNMNAYLFRSYRNQLTKKAALKNRVFESLQHDLLSEKLENVIAKERFVSELIQRLLQILSPREQEIVRLRYFKSYKNKEIAITLNIEYQTVRNILANAIKKMRATNLKMEY